ncbi:MULTISPECIES: hypothetical protein [Burkholderia]|uniref:EF-hand domain-containing protein n=1 Tax=Burkholderia plantarii TaxID=41899 RepID=A0A0B6RXJ4_BURPL|nr:MULTISPECIES: hypothetical protein [Burkholderia]AJK45770.1 hypothetical protein BGL_1c12480 [Burkholderia plantarii]ALK30019.1 hypothetical protein bpln_1g11990 [Burkholderia plantarii]WLE58765.1 hypothetical protein GIY62_16845 [Burkholderia plantarii]GLZ21708.1 hypothetical protein Bpla01_52370 [Burkholderia plantarii]
MIQSPSSISRLAALLLSLALPLLPAAPAFAAAPQAVSTPVPLKGGVDGPFFPRQPLAAPAEATTGNDLSQQAQSRLASSLATNSALADNQSITKAQAQANGLPFIAQHFDQIDTAHSGRVTMQEVRQYLQRQQ